MHRHLVLLAQGQLARSRILHNHRIREALLRAPDILLPQPQLLRPILKPKPHHRAATLLLPGKLLPQEKRQQLALKVRRDEHRPYPLLG